MFLGGQSVRHLAAYRAYASALRRTDRSLDRAEIRAEQAFELSRAGRTGRTLAIADCAIELAEPLGAAIPLARAQKAKSAALIRLQRNEEALPFALASARHFEAVGDSLQLAESLNLAGLSLSNRSMRMSPGPPLSGQHLTKEFYYAYTGGALATWPKKTLWGTDPWETNFSR